MAIKREPFRQKFSSKYVAGGVNRLQYPAGRVVRRGEQVHITRFYVCDETSDGSEARIYVETPGGQIDIAHPTGMSTETAYETIYELVLTTGQVLIAEFSGGTAGDVIDFVVDGYVVAEV